MRKVATIVAVGLLASTALAGTNLVRPHLRTGPRVQVSADLAAQILLVVGRQASQEPMVVGSEICLACHREYQAWRSSAHATMHAEVADDSGSMDPVVGIIFDGNKNGVDDFKEGLNFNDISSAFDAYKPNAPILSFAAGEPYPYRVTIGQITYKVFMKQGGYYQQRLITRIPVTDGAADGLSKSWYMLPFAYSPKNRSYATYNADKWWASGGVPKISPGMSAAQVAGIGRSWTKACVGCHVTGYAVRLASTGEWVVDPPPAVVYQPGDPRYVDLDFDGNREFVGVGCESCHGGGSQHVLGGGDPAKIINPKNLTREQQVWLCAQCHTRGKSVPSGLHDFAYDEAGDHPYRIGDTVWNYYIDEAGRWPDGKSPTKGEQQYQAHEASKHFTNPFHLVLCSECHDPHSGARYLPATKVVSDGLTIPTSVENNTLCLACHATHGPFAEITKAQVADYANSRTLIAGVVSAHSHHPYAPERSMGLSRCTTCHMPLVAKRDYAYDESSHTMEAISPQKTLIYQANGGMPSSCMASCHSQKVNLWGLGLDPDFSKWNEAFDVQSATILQNYYGPGGLWWDVDVTKP